MLAYTTYFKNCSLKAPNYLNIIVDLTNIAKSFSKASIINT